MEDQRHIEKQLAAERAVHFLRSDSIVGLGSGSTMSYVLKEISRAIHSGTLKNVLGVPTSRATADLAQRLNIKLIEFRDIREIDLALDGADEFDENLNLIKGGGGALVREKIVASFAKEFIVVADSSKRVNCLGKFRLPVEVFDFIADPLCIKLKQMGLSPEIRHGSDGSPFVSDNGNFIIDLDLKAIRDARRLQAKLESIPGIVDHGLFLGYARRVVMADGSQVRLFERQ